MTSAPLLISHRTNMGASPENSLQGIDAAVADRADAVELDIRASADGVPVLLHDRSLARTAGIDRAVDEQPLSELRSVGVPTLEDAIERLAGRAILAVEIKQAGIEAAVSAVLRGGGSFGACWIWSFDLEICRTYQAALPGVPVSLLVAAPSRVAGGEIPEIARAHDAGLAGVSLGHRLVTPEAVEAAHRLGLAVHSWTVNEPPDVERVLTAGFDGVVTDFPAGVRRLVEGAA